MRKFMCGNCCGCLIEELSYMKWERDFRLAKNPGVEYVLCVGCNGCCVSRPLVWVRQEQNGCFTGFYGNGSVVGGSPAYSLKNCMSSVENTVLSSGVYQCHNGCKIQSQCGYFGCVFSKARRFLCSKLCRIEEEVSDSLERLVKPLNRKYCSMPYERKRRW